MKTAAKALVIRLYQHPDTAARVVGRHDAEHDLRGWDYRTGDVVTIDGSDYVLDVGSSIQTGDVSGNYLLAEAAPR